MNLEERFKEYKVKSSRLALNGRFEKEVFCMGKFEFYLKQNDLN